MKIFTSDDPKYEIYVGMFGDAHLVDNNSIAMRIMNFFWFLIAAVFLFCISLPILFILALPIFFVWKVVEPLF